MFLSEAVSSGPYFFHLVPFIVYFPLLGLLINIVFGGRLLAIGADRENGITTGEKLVGGLASVASGLSFVVSVLLGITLLGRPHGAVLAMPFFEEWIKIGELSLRWAFQIDTLSVTMMLVVSGVGTLIHIYAIGYMHDDVRHRKDPSRFRRFFVFMNLFILMMLILVSSDNYLMLFVGWEGVGLCSFLLIGFWYDKDLDGSDGTENAMAAKKAFVTNRIGDFGFLLAAFIMFWAFGTVEFNAVFDLAPQVAAATPGVIIAITMFMLLGVTGKSSQIPLYVWLPDAMAGPTPVSALIHAATMVTAGVYLVARSAGLYLLVPAAQDWVALVGAATALFAATIAVGQFDIKKVLAYSTISQLGFMVSAVGMGAFVAGIFHLVTHAFFKALLFLSAGSVIQGVERGHHHIEHDPKLKKTLKGSGHHFDPQDMRNMGGLRTRMKTTFWVYMAGTLALAGIMPFAGFWSKDEILAEGLSLNPLAYGLLTAAAFLTAFYMGRQVFMVFFGKPRSLAAEHASESGPVMTVPLIILALLSTLGGFMNLPFKGFHQFSHWLEHTLEPVFEHAGMHFHIAEFNLSVAAISTILALAAIGVAYWIYNPRRYAEFMSEPPARRPLDPLSNMIGPVFTWLNGKWYIDELYWTFILNPYIALAKFLADQVDWIFWHDWFHDRVLKAGFDALASLLSVRVDLGGIDAIANGLGDGVKSSASSLRRIETGYVRNYALAIFLGVVIIVGYLLLR